MLLAVFARFDAELGLGTLQAARSLDEGRTWLPAVQAGSKPVFEFHDPETGALLPQTARSTSPSRTVGPQVPGRSAWPGRGTVAAPGPGPPCRACAPSRSSPRSQSTRTGRSG